MFTILGDYRRNDNEYLQMDNNFIVKDLESFLAKVKTRNRLVMTNSSSTNYSTNKSVKPDCNCSWSCGFYFHTNDCNTTDGGCGFFGYGDCTGHV